MRRQPVVIVLPILSRGLKELHTKPGPYRIALAQGVINKRADCLAFLKTRLPRPHMDLRGCCPLSQAFHAGDVLGLACSNGDIGIDDTVRNTVIDALPDERL